MQETKIIRKEQIHLLHSCFHGFNRLAHLVLHRMDRDTHSDGYFLVFQPLFLGQQKHFPALSGKESMAVHIRASS